jgi:hypothetical protein
MGNFYKIIYEVFNMQFNPEFIWYTDKPWTDKPWTDKPWTYKPWTRQTLDTTNPGHDKPWTRQTLDTIGYVRNKAVNTVNNTFTHSPGFSHSAAPGFFIFFYSLKETINSPYCRITYESLLEESILYHFCYDEGLEMEYISMSST